MNITMNDSPITNINQLAQIVQSTEGIRFTARDKKEEVYNWVRDVLMRYRYLKSNKKEKAVIKRYIMKMTGYCRSHINRLISYYKGEGKIEVKDSNKRHKFSNKYTDVDIKLLARADEGHDYPNGGSLKRNLEREYEIYHKNEYKNISEISIAHIYNMRKTDKYQKITKKYDKTKSNIVNPIGIKRRPNPENKPGYLRIDSVHQGDGEDRSKGVYHINIIDEVTQFEFIAAVEKLTQEHMVPLVERLIEEFPFKIYELHSDNGTEYVNQELWRLLLGMLVKLTKSRSGKTTDNALVEGKNGSIIRKWIGYGHIPQTSAKEIDDFYRGYFNEYLNYHRICAYPTLSKDKKGKQKKVYKYGGYMTPYEKFKSLPNADKHLKKGLSFKKLDEIAMKMSDNEMADLIQNERQKLFTSLNSL